MKFIDVHSHLNLPEFDADREEVIHALQQEEIGTIVVGVDRKTSESAVELSEKNDNLFACIGVHPIDTVSEVFDYDVFWALASHPKVVAIGECGLDYFRPEHTSVDEKARQKELFQKHMALSHASGKPLMLHCRPSPNTMDAYHDVLTVIKEYNTTHQTTLRGNAHFFVGDIPTALAFAELGFTLSFPGVVTFSSMYDEVVRTVPLASILSETDAPFATPVPHRGKRNSPLYVPYVVSKIAEIRKEDPEMVRIALLENAKRVFGVSE